MNSISSSFLNINFSVFFILTIVLSSCYSKDHVVEYLATSNMYHCELIGFAGQESSIYKHYTRLKSNFTKEELMELTDHDSLAVAIYASEALLERNLVSPEVLFSKSVNDPRRIGEFCGCLFGSTSWAEKIYYAFRSEFNEIDSKGEIIEVELNEEQKDSEAYIDSLILHANVEHELLLYSILNEEKQLPQSEVFALEKWGFEYYNINALEYLFKHHQEMYRNKLLASLKTLLKKLQEDSNAYYDVNDISLQKMIVQLEAE